MLLFRGAELSEKASLCSLWLAAWPSLGLSFGYAFAFLSSASFWGLGPRWMLESEGHSSCRSFREVPLLGHAC